jgi:hypothetical protein
MDSEQIEWCVDVVCDAIESGANDWNETPRVQRHAMSGDRPAVLVVSCLIGKQLSAAQTKRLRSVFPCALLHPVHEVRAYAASGVGNYLLASDRQFAIRCVNALATEATLVQERWNAEKKRSHDARTSHLQIEYEVGESVRERFYEDIDEHAYEQLDARAWTGATANLRALSILSHAPELEFARSAFQRLAAIIVGWWDLDEQQRRGNRQRERSIDTDIALTSQLEQFVLKVDSASAIAILEPIVLAMDPHPREAAQILQGIVGFEDALFTKELFWRIWDRFAEQVRRASWLPHLDGDHPSGGPIMSAIFLTQYWKETTRHWRSLEGHTHRVEKLFNELPPSSRVLDDYARFLYHIAEQSLPEAFELIAMRLQAGDPPAMLRRGNTVFMLETLLRRHVYSRPLELKKNRKIREAILYLLDVLVESGSSAAYKMRDDFVTPLA